MNSICVENLSKQYGGNMAVDQVSFSVRKGDLFGFLGVNGAGKSTVINMLSTLLGPTSGKAEVAGYNLGKQNQEIRSKIGIVYQQNCLDDFLTVEENLLFRGSLQGLSKQQANQKMTELLEEMRMEDIVEKRYKVLSGGQKRKCEIAAALMNTPEILFLDEPTTGLDPATRKDVWSVVKEMQKQNNMTVFLTTHYMEEAAGADEIVVIDSGKIITSGSPHYLREKYAKDKLKLYYKGGKKDEIVQKLSLLGLQAKQEGEFLQVFVEDTLASMQVLEKVKPYLVGFEVVQGTMDDVFLYSVGKKLEAENDN